MCRKDLYKDEVLDRLQAAHAIFIAGGDQVKLTSIYIIKDVSLL